MRFRQRRRVVLLLGIAIVASSLSLLIRSNHFLRRPEQQAIDARFQIRGAEPVRTAGFVIVGIDGRTFSDFNNQGLHSNWPLLRRYDARVIDRLRRAGAKLIAFDLQFTEQTDVSDDNALIEAVGRAHNMVLSTTDVGPHGTTDVLGGDVLLRKLGARAADTSVTPDTDGTIRTTQYSIQGLKTFGVAVAENATGRPVHASLFGGPSHPVPVDYAGPPGTVRTISYSRVYDGRFPAGMFADKIVIVGATSSAIIQDVHETPTSSGTQMSGPEFLANAAATVLDGIPLRDASASLTTLLIVALALVICLVAVRVGTIGVALAGFGLLVLWSLAAQLAFNSGTLLDYSDPAASLVLATCGAVIVGWWAEDRERRRLRRLFAAGAPAVVDQVLQESGPRPLAPTAIIAGYRIEQAIGHGGMGVVYRATQLALERPVAIKLIATERAQDPLFRERFKLESRLAAAIEHVNVIPVYEAGEDDGLLFIAMRLVDGTDLAQLLARLGALGPDRTARLIGQLAGAVNAAHAHGLVHRDIKPANILLTFDEPEHLYLTDFGIAKYVGTADGATVAGQWLGTLDYLAPEQIRGDPVGPSADIYALACLAHQCLTGQVPFPRDNDPAKLWAHINATPPAPTRLQPGLAPSIDKVIARGMAKEPSARFQTAADLADACAQALGITVAVSVTRTPTGATSHRGPVGTEPSEPTAVSP